MKLLSLTLGLLVPLTSTFAATWQKGSMNDPSFFYIESRKFSDLNTEATLTQIPYVSVHWLHKEGGISWRYKEKSKDYSPLSLEKLRALKSLSKLSPSEKYDLARGDYSYSLTKQEKISSLNHKYDWEGHCHGWTVASMKYKLPDKDIIITNKDGLKIPFSPQDTLALLSYFEGAYQTPWDYWVMDHKLPFYLEKHKKNLKPKRVKALLTSMHDTKLKDKLLGQYKKDSITDFKKHLASESKKFKFRFYSPYLGVKNNDPKKYQQDDLNPGALHIVVTNVLGAKKPQNRRGLIADTDPFKPVWNRPLYGYKSKVLSRKKVIDGEELEIQMDILYVHELERPKSGKIVSKEAVKAKRMDYFITLNKKGEIIGGRWKKIVIVLISFGRHFIQGVMVLKSKSSTILKL